MNAPATTVANPNLFRGGDVNRPRIERARLHRQLLDDALADTPDAVSGHHAVIVNDTHDGDKRSVAEDVLGTAIAGHLRIDVDHFAARLLEAGDDDGLYAVIDEARSLAERLRDAALRDGVNIVIDTSFDDPEQAVAVGRQIAEAGYRIDVIDIQAAASTEVPAGVWEAAQRLATDVSAVETYRRYVWAPSDGPLHRDTDLARASLGGPLADAAVARAVRTARAGAPGAAPSNDFGRTD